MPIEARKWKGKKGLAQYETVQLHYRIVKYALLQIYMMDKPAKQAKSWDITH